MDSEDGEVLFPPEVTEQGGICFTAFEGASDRFTASPGPTGHSNQLEQPSDS